ncbi:MAG TPA: DUF2804 domain-containing protein [Nocardioidaceae bacterium]
MSDPALLPEIRERVDLCLPDGRLDPAAVGWSRRPLHRANLRGRGRNKRWEYWAVQTPELVLAVTVSDLDYAGLHAVWFLDPRGQETGTSRLVPLRRVGLPDRSGGGPVHVGAGDLAIDLVPAADGLTLRAETGDLRAQVRVRRPEGHEALGVVVPWSSRRFQYTVKENTLPAEGEVVVGGRSFPVEGPDAWATLDHGRGRWPYRVTWNWGSGSGRVDGRVVGIQLGGRWTDGTGSHENALTLDGRLHPIAEELVWEYDRHDWLSPWRVLAPLSGRVDLTFRPEHERRDRTELLVLGNETHQCFGTWHGTVVDDDGTPHNVDGMRGWAEEVRNRW